MIFVWLFSFAFALGCTLGRIQQLSPSGCAAVVSDKLSIVYQKVFCQYKM